MKGTQTPSLPTGLSFASQGIQHRHRPKGFLAQPNRCLRLALSATLALALSGAALADQSADHVSADYESVDYESADPLSGDESMTRTDPSRGNICFGGLEHGKLIPHDDDIDNHFRQTTLSACSADGGAPTFLPELKPTVPDGILT